jgi:hypothetical protein
MLESLTIVLSIRDSDEEFVHMNFDFRLLLQAQEIIIETYKSFLPNYVVIQMRKMIKEGDVYLMEVFVQLKVMAMNFREFLSEIMTYFSFEETLVYDLSNKPEKDFLKRFEAKKNISEDEFRKIMEIIPNLSFKERRWIEKILIRNDDEKFTSMLAKLKTDPA